MLTTKRTDNYDSVTWQCENEDGSRVDLTGATAQFIMGKKNKLITNAPAQITSAIDGIVQYKLTDSDTLVSGTFLAEFEVTFPNGTKKTFPSNGYITVAIGDNLDNGQVNVVLDMIAAKQGDFEAKLSAILAQAGNINMSSIDEYSWSAIANQVSYTFPITSSYTQNAKWFKVYVGGIPVDDSLINRSFMTSFELMIDPTIIKEGTTVKAEWMQPMAAIAPTSYKVIPQQSSPPVDAVEGDMWFDTSDDTYQGTVLEGIDTRMTNAETSLATNASDLKQRAINPTLPPYNAKFDGITNDTTAIQNAINDLSTNGILFLPKGTDLALIKSPITLKSNITIYSEGSGFKGVYTTPSTILTGTNLQNIKLKGLVIDGGASGAPSDITANRTVRFINCSNIRVEDCEISHGYDWQLSFENCTDCRVRNHKSYGLGDGYPGGRDGIHFLDCDNCTVDGAYIESGDDCVGVTTQTKTSSNITVKNVSGKSSIGSIVVFAQEGATAFQILNGKAKDIEALSTVRYVLSVQGMNGVTHQDFYIDGIRGTSSNHGIYLNKVNNVKLTGGCFVTSTTQHGIYLYACSKVSLGEGITAKALASGFCGLQVDGSCSNVIVNGSEFRESGLWGIQLLNSSDIFLCNVRSYENGGLSFASNTGGNLRVSGCTRVRINNGIYSGATTISYYGIALAGGTGGTDVVITNAIRAGATP